MTAHRSLRILVCLALIAVVGTGAGCASDDVTSRAASLQTTVEASTTRVKETIDRLTAFINKLRAIEAVVNDEDGSASQAAIDAAREGTPSE